MDIWEPVKDWFLRLGDTYHVDPIIFGSIYVGAIPFFFVSLGRIVHNLKKNKPIILPVFSAGFFFLSAYLYLIIAGRHIPVWVYLLIGVLTGYGTGSTIRRIRKRIKEHRG